MRNSKSNTAQRIGAIVGKTCDGKFCYGNKWAADNAMQHARSGRGGKHIERRVYACKKCGFWHVTSMTKKKDFDNLRKKLGKGASFAVEKENVDEMTYGLMASSDIVDKVRTIPVEEGTLVIVSEDVEIINNVSTSQVDAMKTLGIRCGEDL